MKHQIQSDVYVMDITDRTFGSASSVSRIMDAFDALEKAFNAMLIVSFSFQKPRLRTPPTRWNRILFSDTTNGLLSSCDCSLKSESADLMQFTLYCSDDEYRIPTLNFTHGNASEQIVKASFQAVVRAFNPLWASCRNESRFDRPDMNTTMHYLTIPVLRTFTYFGNRYVENVFHGAAHVARTPNCFVEPFMNGFLLDFSLAADADDFQHRRETAQWHLLPHPVWGAGSTGNRALSDALYFKTSFEEEMKCQVRDPSSDCYDTPRFRQDLQVILARVEKTLSEAYLRRRVVNPLLAERHPQGGEVLLSEYRSYGDIETLREMARRETAHRSPRVICFVLAYSALVEREEGPKQVFVEEVRDEWFRLRETFCIEMLSRPKRLGPRKRIILDGC